MIMRKGHTNLRFGLNVFRKNHHSGVSREIRCINSSSCILWLCEKALARSCVHESLSVPSPQADGGMMFNTTSVIGMNKIYMYTNERERERERE